MASKGFNRFGVIPLHQFVGAIRLWLPSVVAISDS
jgi:hypothetical protein